MQRLIRYMGKGNAIQCWSQRDTCWIWLNRNTVQSLLLGGVCGYGRLENALSLAACRRRVGSDPVCRSLQVR